MRRFLLQMAGRAGAGKSTVARRIAKHTGAIVVDLDVLKSTALDVGVEWNVAGSLAYRTCWAVAEELLDQGLSVICDSPCRFPNIVEQTMAIAERQHVPYRFIECVTEDLDELSRRLTTRSRRRSQLVDATTHSDDAPHDSELTQRIRAGDRSLWATVYPPIPWLQLDTTEGVDRSVEKALDYLTERT